MAITKARLAGLFYVVAFVFGVLAMALRSGRVATNTIAALSYVAVTILFYQLFKPVNRTLSAIAASLSLAGCAVGSLALMHLMPVDINPLVFFGFYCLLIGYLVVRSTFLPPLLGFGMMMAGLAWLTFISASVARAAFPFNVGAGMVGEGALTIWLVAVGARKRA